VELNTHKPNNKSIKNENNIPAYPEQGSKEPVFKKPSPAGFFGFIELQVFPMDKWVAPSRESLYRVLFWIRARVCEPGSRTTIITRYTLHQYWEWRWMDSQRKNAATTFHK